MSDSNLTKPLPAILPEGVTSLVVTKKSGTVVEVLKDKKGQFTRKPKPLIPTVDFTRKERKILNTVIKEGDDAGLTEHEAAFRNMLRIAQHYGDGKENMAAVKAYEITMRRALGKEDPSERELDKLERQPITVIHVQAPPLTNPEIIDGDKPKDKPKQPDFAEVTSITTNKK